jgi:hypothetical protein
VPVPAPLLAPPTRNYRAPDAVDNPPPRRYVAPERPAKKIRQERPDRYERDICRGKGKRYTNNKRSWRCKR